MLFNVSGLIQEGIGATREYSVDETITGVSGEPERLNGQVNLLRTKAGVLVRAYLTLSKQETCSRCAVGMDEDIDIEFEEEFHAIFEPRSGQLMSERPDDDAFLIDSQHILDLTEAVRQYSVASAEMQPLCRPECRGLCPSCGRDLNTGDCLCENGPVDDRWAQLAALREGSLSSSATSEGKD